MQQSFRSIIVARDNSCLITGFHRDTCDSAHIIPAHVCHRLGMVDDLNTGGNGLLLCKSLHGSFDRLLWTFDIFDIRTYEKDYYLPIIISQPKARLLVNQYIRDNQGENIYHKIPKECLPYLYIHYLVWVKVNTSLPSEQKSKSKIWNTKVPEADLYKNVLSKVAFYIWRKHVGGLVHSLQLSKQDNNQIWLIIKYSIFLDRYLVLYWGSAWNQTVWVKSHLVPLNLKGEYHNLLEKIQDKDYVK